MNRREKGRHLLKKKLPLRNLKKEKLERKKKLSLPKGRGTELGLSGLKQGDFMIVGVGSEGKYKCIHPNTTTPVAFVLA